MYSQTQYINYQKHFLKALHSENQLCVPSKSCDTESTCSYFTQVPDRGEVVKEDEINRLKSGDGQTHSIPEGTPWKYNHKSIHVSLF